MRNGFTFKGRHSSEFGVTVKTRSRPIRPEAKHFGIDLPYRDGEYDFSASNALGREFFYGRTFSVSISVYAENLTSLQEKLSKISLWLMGSGRLIFDDIPLVAWEGGVSDEIIYMPEREGKKAVLDVSFRVKPFGFGLLDTNGPVLDDEILLDTNFPIGIDDVYKFSVKNGSNVHILNYGDRPVRPVMEITGNAADMTLTLGGKSMSFKASGAVKVDFDRQRVTNSSGDIGVSGEFFELEAGENILNIKNSNYSTLTLTVSFMPEYVYSVNLSEVEWGVNSA